MGQKQKEVLQAIGLVLISLQFLFLTPVCAQEKSKNLALRKDNLLQFSKEKTAAWEFDNRKADSLAKAQDLPVSYQEANKGIVILQRLGFHNKPVYYATDNVDAASVISTDQLWTGEEGLPLLTGENIEINLWDGGAVLETHREFIDGEESRIFMRDRGLQESHHSTHVAGTMIGAGVDRDAKGMAGKANVIAWDFSNDLAEMAVAASEGISISNHSYGPLCGWYYDSNLDCWFWHGDPEISTNEDYQFGLYDGVSSDMDYIAWNAQHYLIVKSAGNDRNDGPEEQTVEHFVWDGSWVASTQERDPDGGADGFDCLTPMAVPKNILTVGAVDDNRVIADFSAFGPTDDGRIKPDVLANGTDVYSSIALSDHSYDHMNGTSMAAASASGSISLIQQLQVDLQPGEPLLSSTVKGLLVHTADECGNEPGPDYKHGWGILNTRQAIDLMLMNYRSGGNNIYEGVLSEGESVIIPVESATPAPDIKITLCWIDPPGDTAIPALNLRDSKLINDLNLELINAATEEIYFPWKLDPEFPEAPASMGVNHVDNVEQLLLESPASGNYLIKISHTGSLYAAIQSYSLIVTGISIPSEILPPRLLQFHILPSEVSLEWSSPEQNQQAYYRIYRNGVLLAETMDTVYTDQSVITDSTYEYYTTAVYARDGNEPESLGSNKVTAVPRTLKSLPYIIDFEEGHSEVLIKDSPNGWQWGDSETLSSYYLIFDENSTYFIGADSYTNGMISHVHDVASTLPLKLDGCSDVVLSLDYMLVSGIYDAMDELHIMYKLQEELEWHELIQLPRAHSWTSYSIPIPDTLYMNGIQFGFYYDDFKLWGMGAALDNISIVGETPRSVDLEISSMISPVSACTLTDAELVRLVIVNAGESEALPGDVFSLTVDISPGIQIEEQLVLSEVLQSGEQLTYQFNTTADLSETGTYSFVFLLSSNLDINELNNSLSSMAEHSGYPLVQILNSDLQFCEDEEPVLIQCSPEGGKLSGPGVTGLYFDPASAGEGVHTLSYEYTDLNGCPGSTSVDFEVVALPKPVIMNEDLQFCRDDPPAIIQVFPEGGILSGPGISGLYFDPQDALTGCNIIHYKVVYQGECTGHTSSDFFVYDNPVVDLGVDRQMEIDDTIELIPTGNGISYLWFNATTGNSLSIIGNDLGIGRHDIWVETYSQEGCSGRDSLLITIDESTGTTFGDTNLNSFVYPNPFKTGFRLEIPEDKSVESVVLHDLTGRIFSNHIPSSYPYFHFPNLPPGSYFLKVITGDKIHLIRIIKI